MDIAEEMNDVLRARSKGECMPSREGFRELKVWQKAQELTLAVYRVTATFPREELYGLLRPADYESLAPAPPNSNAC